VALVVGACLGLLLVLLTFYKPRLDGGLRLVPRFDLGDWLRDLPSHLGWVIPYVVLTATLPALRALVWKLLLPAPPPRFRDVYHSVALGGLVHNALPGKMGPLASAWLLGRWASKPFGVMLATLLLAKLLELGAVVTLTGLSAASSASLERGTLPRILGSGVAVFLVLAVAAVGLRRLAPRWGMRIAHRLPRLGRLLETLGSGLGTMGSRRTVGIGGLAALAPALVSAIAYGVGLHRFGVPGGWLGGGLLLGIITFGQLTPGLPVAMGVYYFLCSWGARQLGAAPDQAAALAVLSHLATVATHLCVGLASAVLHRGALKDVLRLRRQVSRGDVVAASTPLGGDITRPA
jgi:hypothetical protein